MAPGRIDDRTGAIQNSEAWVASPSAKSTTVTEPRIASGPPSRAVGSVYDRPLDKLVDRHIDEPRSLKVVVIGGGLAGILAGVLLPKKVPGIELTIFEKNKDFVCLLSRDAESDGLTPLRGRHMA